MQKECLETVLKGIGGGGESCIKRQIIPDCGCKVAEGSFAKFSGEPLTIKKKLIILTVSIPHIRWLDSTGYLTASTPACKKARLFRETIGARD